MSHQSDYGRYETPKRVQILHVRSGSYYKPGQYGYVLSFDDRGGYYTHDTDTATMPGERAYLVSKSRHGRGGAVWFTVAGLRFTGGVRR